MANPVTINPTLTLAGQAAAFNASGDGLELKITHVTFGRAHYDPTGDEVALVDPVGGIVPVAGASRPTPYQIRMVSAWREDVGQVGVGEIGFWAGDVLVFVWSKADGTVASYKTDGVTYVLFNDLAFAQVPANSVSFVVDPDESVALAALAAHEGAHNAHPQYVLRAKFPDYQGHLWGTVGGTANSITLALPAIVELTEYILGNRFSFKALYTNTGATTINISGVGAVAVLKTGGVPLTAGSIIAGGVYDVYFDGASFQLTAGAGFASAEATEAEVLDPSETTDSTSWVSVRRLRKAMYLKAPLLSPAFTGTPTAPTPAANSNSTQIATTAFVKAAISALIDAAPGAMDTLKELAAALGNDPNYATTIANALGLKAPLASPALTGVPTTATPGVNAPANQIPNLSWVSAAIAAAGPVFINTDDATDWDSIVTGGWYSKILSRNAPNSPGQEVSYWYCLVLSYNGGSITQVAFPYASGSLMAGIKTRSRYQGAWTAWVTPYTTANVATVIKNLLAATTSAAALSAIGAAPLASPQLTGTPAAPTPDQFDATTKIATTEFVQRALGNFRFSTYNINASRALTVADVGSTLATNTAANITLTLPSVTDVAGGGALHIYNQGTGITSLVAAAGGGAIRAGNVPVGTMELLPGDTVTLVRIPGDGVWYAMHGSVANRYSGQMMAPVWTTPDQFDATKKLATTEFVQRAIGGYQAHYSYSTAGQTIPPSRVNSLINLNTGATTITLPLSSSVPIGSKVYIRTSNASVISRQGTDVIYGNTANTTETSIQVGANSNITFINAGSGLWFIAGNASLAWDTSLFGFLKGSNGYQKLPSGIIIQWCNGQIAAGQTSARITLPMAFPYTMVAYSLNTANAGHWVTGQNASETGIDIIPRTINAGNIIIPPGVVGYTSMFIGY